MKHLWSDGKRVIFIFFASVLLLNIWACSSLYVARDKFASPLPVKLAIRNDSYSEGVYGAKRSNGRVHNGIDLSAKVGTPVLAAKDGVVRHAGYKKGNGNYIIITHPWGYSTYYCHLSKIAVNEGQRVKEGQVIGSVGKTGNADFEGMKPHLHFEIHKNGIPENPTPDLISKT